AGTLISSGGTLTLECSADGTVISGGGLELVSSGGFDSSVTISGSGALTVIAGGTVSRGGDGGGGRGGAATTAHGGVTRGGGAAGATLAAGATVNNSGGGLIAGNYFGVYVSGAPGMVTNAGTIAAITNLAPNGVNAGISLDAGGSIANAGLVSGLTGIGLNG